MTDNLRALAAEAIRAVREGDCCHVDRMCEACEPCSHAFARAVLAAVLPAHRRQVLTEAVDAIEREPFDLKVNDGTAATGGYLRPQTATDAVRRLAETAPPAPCGGTESVQDAPVVPEEAPKPHRASEKVAECERGTPGGDWCARPVGHDGPCSPKRRVVPSARPVAEGGLDESPWRAGRKVDRTVYRQAGPAPGDADVLIGVMDTPALAAQVVAEHEHAVGVREFLAGAEAHSWRPTRRPDDAGAVAARLIDEQIAAQPAGEFVAVSRTEWAAVRRDRAEAEHLVDGLADAALRLVGAQQAAADRGRFAMQVALERDRLRDAVDRVRAALDDSRRAVARFRASQNPACDCEWDLGAMSAVESVQAALGDLDVPQDSPGNGATE